MYPGLRVSALFSLARRFKMERVTVVVDWLQKQEKESLLASRAQLPQPVHLGLTGVFGPTAAVPKLANV